MAKVVFEKGDVCRSVETGKICVVVNDVCVIVMEFYTRFSRGKQKFLGNKMIDTILLDDASDLILGRGLKIDPDHPVVLVSRMHEQSI